jgi:hypothetical protein
VTRRRLTVRRIDPWSVLKFGAVANVVLLLIWLLVVGVVFYIVDRIGLVDQVCDVVLEVGFEACGVNAGNLFRAIALLGLLGVVILTAVLVFLSFLHNLIADLTGGLTFTVNDDSPVVQRPVGAGNAMATTGGARPPGIAPPSAARTIDGTHADRRQQRGPPVPPLGSERTADRGTGQQDRAATTARDRRSAPPPSATAGTRAGRCSAVTERGRGSVRPPPASSLPSRAPWRPRAPRVVRAHSSARLERTPDKGEADGSSPSGPTDETLTTPHRWCGVVARPEPIAGRAR